MRIPRSTLAVMLVVATLGCADDQEPAATEPSTTTLPTLPSTTLPSTTLPSTTLPSTSVTAPCEADAVLARIDDALGAARLEPGGPWSTATGPHPSTDRTASAEDFAARLGLDCATRVVQTTDDAQRLALAAWTGERAAWIVQATDQPSTPYAADATVDVGGMPLVGETLDDARSRWAGIDETSTTVILGHDDFSLAAAAKAWTADWSPPADEEVNLAAEEHAIEALTAAGMRKVSVAQTPELGSEEGFVQFTTPEGQISVADVGPTGWFDPLIPRYFSGATTVETIDGVEVRVTQPNPGDNAGLVRGADIGWSCAGFVWLLEPPFNGTADEMLASAAAVIATPQCRGE